MKKDLIIIAVLAIVFMNSTVAMAGTTNTEKAANLTYYKAGILWDISGLTFDTTNDKNIRDLHVDGEISYLNNFLGFEDVNYKQKFNLGFLNLTMVFLVSREPLQ